MGLIQELEEKLMGEIKIELERLRAEEPDTVLRALRSACESKLDAICATNRANRMEGKIRNALLIADDPGFGQRDGDMEDVLGLLRVAIGDGWHATTRERGASDG